jgi:gamma-glutamyltranspeptidase / glutathione hydrolase
VRPLPALSVAAALSLALPLLVGAPASAAHPEVAKAPVAVGSGGAVTSVDADASAAGLAVLRQGGNAVDAAVATAAAVGVTDPYSAGIGGGGFMVGYDAASGQVWTIDGRETAPAAMREDSLQGVPFAEAVTSGLGVGVPGTPRTWQRALERFGTKGLPELLAPAIHIAEEGFVVDDFYLKQTADNAARFRDFTSTPQYYLTRDGQVPAPGTVVRNPDLAAAYRLMAEQGIDAAFYNGPIGRAVAATAQTPPQAPDSTRTVRPGLMTEGDLARYDAPFREPTRVGYRGLDVWGMAPPSSGGTTMGEALNILEGYDLGALSRTDALHRYLEASALAFADRGRYVGDPGYTRVPVGELLSDAFAADRRGCIDPTRALPKPVRPGVPDGAYDGACGPFAEDYAPAAERLATTHLTTADRWGNVVSYTLTIEQTGGSGIAVPGFGFLLNNELTDFDFTPGTANSPAGGKRPRSSIAPTIVTRDGTPVLALGSPGGSTIITTVLQVLVEHLDLGRSLPDAVAAPRASQRNTATVSAEPAFLEAEAPGLQQLGHEFSTMEDIGAATAIALLGDGRMQAVAEPVRRGGGSAVVVSPDSARGDGGKQQREAKQQAKQQAKEAKQQAKEERKAAQQQAKQERKAAQVPGR